METVKYIPQQFLERLCNEEQTQFETELKAVVYSHIPISERFGATDLDSLVSLQSEALQERVIKTKALLSELNVEIASLEKMVDPQYRKKLEQELEASRRRLRSHTRQKPKEVIAPRQNEEAKEIRSRAMKTIRAERRKLKLLEEQSAALTEEVAANKQCMRLLKNVEQEVANLALEFEEFRKKREEPLQDLGIKFSDVANLFTNVEPLKLAQKPLLSRAREIRALLDPSMEDSVAAQIAEKNSRITELQQQLRGPEKEYEDYCQSLAQWEKQRTIILGNKSTPDTHNYIRSCLLYLNNQLREDLEAKRLEREQLVDRIWEAKTQILDLYRQCYQPVSEFIGRYKDTQEIYEVSFTVRFRVEGLVTKTWEFINHGVRGTFYGSAEGRRTIEQLVSSRDVGSKEGIKDLQRSLVDSFEHDRRDGENGKQRAIARQIKDGDVTNFYDYLFGLDYLIPSYEIRMVGKSLAELSPGERGALLLIFYLLIDRSDTPLIIDQPEENLDNQSVYQVLVKFIRDAKRRRQVIIATHNSNIAVCCDAEQVIYTVIDKPASYRTTYLSGAIENPAINAKLVDVLESTMPAFQLRDSKYTITRLSKERC